MSQNDAVVVTIVDYGRADDVTHCLKALTQSVFKPYEVVVVENGGPVAFERLCAALDTLPLQSYDPQTSIPFCADVEREKLPVPKWKRYRAPGGQSILAIMANDNLGYAGGMNLGIRALGKVPGWRAVWVLNPDTQPDPHALEQLVLHAEKGGYGLVGARLIIPGENRIQSRGSQWRPLIARGRVLGLGDPADAPVDVAALESQIQWIGGASIYASRAYLETIGLMEEKYFIYCEDVEWALRRGKFRLGYAHEAKVYHVGGTTIGSALTIGQRSNLSVYLAERNKLLMSRSIYPALYPLILLITLVLLADYLVRGNKRVFYWGIRGWWAGFLGEIGKPKFRIPSAT